MMVIHTLTALSATSTNYSVNIYKYSVVPSSGSPTPVATVAPHVQLLMAMDSTTIAAWIGFTGAILVALISLSAVVYQMRRNAKIEKEKVAAQVELERERIRFQAKIDEDRALQERQRQRQEMNDEAALAAMERAQTMSERIHAYRAALQADPRIAQLQILDMSHPLDVTNVFVRVRLHREARPSYEIDAALLAAEEKRDPNELLRTSREYLKARSDVAIEPEEAIHTYKRCVFVGDPGAGKTTMLKYITLQAAKGFASGAVVLPIHIELNAFAGSGYSDLLDFAATRWDDRYGFPKGDARACIEDHLRAGSALLLLDALDETAIGNTTEESNASYKRVTEAITQLATRYYQSPVVVTARKAGYYQHTQLPGFTVLEVLDFRPEDIEQFVKNWFVSSPHMRQQASADDLNVKLAHNPRLQALAANPLLLSLIAVVYEDQLDLPDRRAELYKQCMDILLTKWDASRDIRRRREFKPEYKRQLLEEVAWHFHCQGRRYVPESDLLDVIADFLPIVGLMPEQNIRILEEIVAENGLLKEQARHWYGFLHLTLQEYFVALYVNDHQQIDALLEHLGDPWWEEVLLLYAGHTPDASPLLRRLIGEDDQNPLQDDIFQTNLVMAGRCLAARPAIRDLSLRKKIIARLLQELKRTRYGLAAGQFTRALAEIGGEEIIAELARLHGDDQIRIDIRSAIVDALDNPGMRAIVPDLLRLLNDSPASGYMGHSIVRTLGKLGEKSVVPDLLLLLSDPRSSHLLAYTIIPDALKKLGEKSVAADLVRLLEDAQLTIPVRQQIAQTVGRLGEKSVAADLVRLLENTQLAVLVRRNIAQALGVLGEKSVVVDLVRLLKDDQIDKSVLRLVANAVGVLKEPSVIPDLLGLLNDGQTDKSIHRSIVGAIGTIGEPSVVPDLQRLLNDPQSSFIHVATVLALGKLGEKSMIPRLIDMLNDPQISLSARRRSADVLGTLGEQSVVPDLLGMLNDPHFEGELYGAIAKALVALKERSIAPILVRLLSDEQIEIYIRRLIADCLGELGENEVVPALMSLLHDEQLDVLIRGPITKCLGVLGERSIVPDLICLLNNEELSRGIEGHVLISLEKLVDDLSEVQSLASLLNIPHIRADVYSPLYRISRRMKLRIFMTDEQEIKVVKC